MSGVPVYMVQPLGKVPASPSHVLSRGELIVQDDQWVGEPKQGRGQFFRRGTFSR